MTQQDADAALDVVTGIISILDHDAYTLVDLGAMHSFASKHFLDRFQIKTQQLEGRMRVSLPAGDPLFSDRVVRDSRVLIGGQEFPADLVALDMRDFQAVFYAWISYGLVQVLNSYNCNLNVKFCFMHFLIQVSYIHYQIPVTILGMFLLDR